MSLRLALHFLGPPQLYLNNEPVTADRRKALALLAYLAVEGGKQTRDSLSALLWPDYDQSKAFTNLRHTLWEIQQTIGEGWIHADRETIGLNTDVDIALDVHQFESLLAQSRVQESPSLRIPLLSDAAKLYRNHFLTGFSLKDALGFNEWAFAQSEELRHKLAIALTLLVESHCTLNQAESAIPYARRLITLDPLNEAAHRQLMEVYLQAGQHSAALKQYQACEQLLRKELGIDPQPETRNLYKKIRKGELKAGPVEKETEKVTPQTNLPSQLSTFIGRDQQQDQITNLIAKHRLVTLVGAGGIGKTRLALQMGQKLLNHYPNGVWFIGLDSLSDPTLVPQTIASVFNVRESPNRPITETLIDSLLEKTALLIFDNCEHLLEACAQLIATLLQICPNLKILATSRETLNLPGEAIYYMPPLSIPEQDVAMEGLTEYESIRLFTERAALAQSSFTLKKENARTVVEICRKVDGIPLALELAAARVNMLKVEEILKQLNDSFALLASDSRTILPRQQTLQASMDWSWGLLNESEQVFLQQLSVFAGGWTLESAQAVCEGDVLGLISALVKKSLIVVHQETRRETRYRFHEIVRAYALEKLVQSGNQENIRTRHLNYFVHLSKQAELELRGPTRVEWMERLNEERNNIRAALHWADKTDVEAGLHLSSRLMRYWESSNLQEGRQWLKNFIHKPESKDFPRARAHALHTYSWLLTWLQKFDEAYSVAEESLGLFSAANDREGEVDALISLENILQFKDKMEASIELGEEALVLSQSIGDLWREANSLNYLGWGYSNFERRLPYWKRAITLYRQVGDQINLANLLGLLGQFQVLNGDIELAEKNLTEAMQLWQSNKRANVWENPKIAKSLIFFMRGDYEQAQALLQEIIVSAEETGNLIAQLWAEVRLGHVALHAGNLSEADELLGKTAKAFGKDGYTIGAVFALEGMAGLYVTVGKVEQAARLIGWADRMRMKIKDPRPNFEQANVDKIVAACLAKMGEVAFSDAYDEGQKMTLDEAVAYVLGES
jgi:predicted ATPase/DNA-binding SARP family transcriptional activator